MACKIYNWFDSKAQKTFGRELDGFDFVERADKWIDSTLERAQRSWLTICFVATICIHCVLVVVLSNNIFSSPPNELAPSSRFWGRATLINSHLGVDLDVDRASGVFTGFSYSTTSFSFCERDYWASNFVAEFHNAYSNLLFVLVGVGALNLCHQHKLPQRMYILALWIVLMGLTGGIMHTTLHREWQVANDVCQAGLMITLYWCKACPYGGAAGFTMMALISCTHFVTASACLVVQVTRFAEVHMIIMVLLILHNNYKSTLESPVLLQRMARSIFLLLGCLMCHVLDGPACFVMNAMPVNPQLQALSNLLGSISVHEAVVVTAALVAEHMGGVAHLGVVGYGRDYPVSSAVGWAGLAYVEDIEYGIKSVKFTNKLHD